MALFALENLSLTLGGAEVLHIPSLEIAEGERLVLVGANGSGKTSLLKVLAALVAPSRGTLRFGDLPLGAKGDFSRRVVYLHQQPYIMAGSVSYNVEFGARARGLPAAQAALRAADAMRLLCLEGFGRRGHRELSGGEAQRVALARAICSGSDVLLLDEPTASADSSSRELIARVLREKAASGATIVLATHDAELADALTAASPGVSSGAPRGASRTRTITLERGRIVEGAAP